MFFAKDPVPVEIISDLDGDLMNFYKSLKNGDIDRCDLTPNKEKLLKLANKRNSNTPLTPCEYLYLNKISFGASMNHFDHNTLKSCRGEKAKRCKTMTKDDAKYAERLRKTKIISGDFKRTSLAHDSKDTLHYLDPPYAETNQGGYRGNNTLTPADVKQLTDKLKGKVILSYNDSSQVRKEFCSREAHGRGYRCRRVHTTYTLNNTGKQQPKTELLITKGF